MSLRPVLPMDIPFEVSNYGSPPTPIVVDPLSVLIDESYQRDLTRGSARLVRKIIENFAWHKYKPPLLVPHENGYKAIDGQHTLIACATLRLKAVPAMLYDSDFTIAQQADSFVSHNTNRLSVGAVQLYHARVAAGDADTLSLKSVLDEAGITVPRTTFLRATDYDVGDTIAMSTMYRMLRKRTRNQVALTAGVVAGAKLRPIRAVHWSAADYILWDMKDVSPYDLTTVIRDVESRETLVGDLSESSGPRAVKNRVDLYTRELAK